MTGSGTGYSVQFAALQQASTSLEADAQSIASLEALANPGQAEGATGSASASAGITELGLTVTQFLHSLTAELGDDVKGLQQNLANYQSAESAGSEKVGEVQSNLVVSGVADEVAKLGGWKDQASSDPEILATPPTWWPLR